MNFHQKLEVAIKKNNSLLCIGLDTDIKKIPQSLLKTKDPLFAFNKAIIDATHHLVCAYKPNIAYYSALGVYGLQTLQETIIYIHKTYPDIPVIADAKRADIGNTSEKYTDEAFEVLQTDAVTVNPYLGFDAIEPFLRYKDKGIIILCRTSNPGASDFQDLIIDNKPLYLHVAEKIVAWNKESNNCLMVVGATGSTQMKMIREIAKDMFFLVPGIGSQGGDIQQVLENGLTKEKSGLIINASRAIIYASAHDDFAQKAKEKAEELRNSINQYR